MVAERSQKSGGKKSGARRRSTRPILIGAGVLLFGALGAFGWQVWRKSEAAAAARADLVSRIATELGKAEPDTAELARLEVQVKKLPDADTARDLLAARARIELLRDRPERAFALFGDQSTAPGALPAERGLGADMLLRLAEIGTGDASEQKGQLLRAQEAAAAAYAASNDVADLLHCWQAATRVGDDAAAKQFATQLREQHAGSPAAKLADVHATFDPKTDRARLDELRTEFARVPPELDAMRALALLQAADFENSLKTIDSLLVRAAGVPSVRWAAALVFFAWASSQKEGSVERAGWIERRDVQLDWLLQRAPGDDKTRQQWQAMRARR